MDEIYEQKDNLRRIQEILVEPVVGFDDSELEAELDELEAELDGREVVEELEAKLLQPASNSTAAPAAENLPTPPPARPLLPQQHGPEADELAARIASRDGTLSNPLEITACLCYSSSPSSPPSI